MNKDFTNSSMYKAKTKYIRGSRNPTDPYFVPPKRRPKLFFHYFANLEMKILGNRFFHKRYFDNERDSGV